MTNSICIINNTVVVVVYYQTRNESVITTDKILFIKLHLNMDQIRLQLDSINISF